MRLSCRIATIRTWSYPDDKHRRSLVFPPLLMRVVQSLRWLHLLAPV